MSDSRIPWGYLYETTNLVNGMFYVGIKRAKRAKFNPKYLGSGQDLIIAIKEFGASNFRVRLLAWAYSMDELGLMEKEAIADYRNFYGRERLYNISSGGYPWGGGMNGVKHTPETRLRISQAATERWAEWRKQGLIPHRKHTAEALLRMSESQKKRQKEQPMSPETKKKIGLGHVGKKASPEACLNMSKAQARIRKEREEKGLPSPLLGFSHSPETKAKISAASMGNKYRLGIPHSAESKAKMRLAAIGKVITPQHRLNLSKSQWGKVISEDCRRKISQTLTGRLLPESTKAAMRLGQQKYRARQRMDNHPSNISDIQKLTFAGLI